MGDPKALDELPEKQAIAWFFVADSGFELQDLQLSTTRPKIPRMGEVFSSCNGDV